jgi:hypothetical protein
LAGLNGDMRARADVMHGCGVGGSTDQQGQNQSGTHPDPSVSNEFRSCAYARPRSQGAAASRPVKSAGSWGVDRPRQDHLRGDARTSRARRAGLLCGSSVQRSLVLSPDDLTISDARSAASVAPTCGLTSIGAGQGSVGWAIVEGAGSVEFA